MDWAAFADDEAFPSLRMAVRGGSVQQGGHGMADLLSIRCRVNGELMITDQQDGGYMSTTFTKRCLDLYGRSIASKSTLFVDGLGANSMTGCDKTEVVKAPGIHGIRVDASHSFLPRWKDKFIGRLCILVENSYWLVLDRVEGSSVVDTHWLESRFHTMAESKSGKDWVSLKSGKEKSMMTFAGLGKGVLTQGMGMPSQPGITPTTIYRWTGADAYADNLQVAAINPGSKKLGLSVTKEKGGVYAITVKKPGGKTRIIRVTKKLKLKKA